MSQKIHDRPWRCRWRPKAGRLVSFGYWQQRQEHVGSLRAQWLQTDHQNWPSWLLRRWDWTWKEMTMTDSDRSIQNIWPKILPLILTDVLVLVHYQPVPIFFWNLNMRARDMVCSQLAFLELSWKCLVENSRLKKTSSPPVQRSH